MDKEYKSYSWIYWISWIILIILSFITFFLGKIFKIYFLQDIPLIMFFFVFFMILFIFLGVFYNVTHARLLSYLKKNHYEKWKELTTIQHLGSGYYNGKRIRKFLYSKETLNDSIISILKNEYKSIVLLCFVNFFTIAFIITISIILLINGFISPVNFLL